VDPLSGRGSSGTSSAYFFFLSAIGLFTVSDVDDGAAVTFVTSLDEVADLSWVVAVESMSRELMIKVSLSSLTSS